MVIFHKILILVKKYLTLPDYKLAKILNLYKLIH